MARRIHVFAPPQRFVAGTVGSPGARSFYLQARDGVRLVTVAVEKAQVVLLAEQLTELLDELGRHGVAAGLVAPVGAPDTSPLERPIEADFWVATIALGWDPRGSRVVVEAQAAGGEGSAAGFSDDPDGPDALRVLVAAGAARAFARRAGRLVDAGRPSCPLCGQPLDDDHVCPRQNGHRL